MLIFVYGPDSFRVQEKVTQLKHAYLEKHDPSGLNLVLFPQEGMKLQAGDVIQAVTTLPFLAKRRMIIIRDLLATVKGDESKVWETGLSRTPESTIVILWEIADIAIIEKKSLFKALSKFAEIYTYPFQELSGSKLTLWIYDRIKAKGGMIEADAVRVLIEHVASDLWQMSHEIEKLIAFSNGATITETMVNQLIQPTFEGKIFELVDALSRRDAVMSIRLLEEERFAGSDDFYLLSMFARQIRLLIGARALLDENARADKQEIAARLHIHPFVAGKILAQAKRFSLRKLLLAHEQLFVFERGTKNGGIQVDLAVDLIATELLRK